MSATYPPSGQTAPLALPFWMVQNFVLWVFVASSWFVIIEPAPYEFLFVLTLLMFLHRGMAASPALIPLVTFLVLFNLGGAFSVSQVSHLPKTVQFIATSLYMGATAIFFAFAVARDPGRIVPIVRNAYIVAAVIASVCGLAGYFNIAGMGDVWAPISRAQGTFKDPNVLSTFLILPAVFLIQGFVLGSQKWWLTSVMTLLAILAALFLAFSRGAWMNMFASSCLMFGLTFILSPSLRVRSRIVLSAISGVIVIVALITFALSFSGIREIFLERASLIQSYDGGATGRFANQLRGLLVLVEEPNGLGPFQFSSVFGEDPHNVYLNAFAAYGWLGGFSYLLLSISTLLAAWRAVFTPTPYQKFAIPVVSVLIATMLQGVQIDTDHWRHFYLLLGVTWGLCAASYLPQPNSTRLGQTA